MSTQYETGHARNLAAFETIISFCSSYGADYQPTQDNLKISAMQTQLAGAEAALELAKQKQALFINATNSRALSYEPIKSLAMRIIYALVACGASKQTIESAKTIKRKLVGKRASKVPAADSPEAAIDKTNSSSQQSFDQILSAYNSLIELLETQTNYAPNEADLQIAALKTLVTTLKEANTNVINSKTDWAASRTQRDKLLYAPQTGILDTAQQVKNYVRSIYGPSSTEYKKVSGLEMNKVTT